MCIRFTDRPANGNASCLSKRRRWKATHLQSEVNLLLVSASPSVFWLQQCLERFHSFYFLTSAELLQGSVISPASCNQVLFSSSFLNQKSLLCHSDRLLGLVCMDRNCYWLGQFSELVQLVYHPQLPPFWKSITFLSALQFASDVLSVGGTGLYWELSWKAVACSDSSNSHRPYVEAPRPFLTHQQTWKILFHWEWEQFWLKSERKAVIATGPPDAVVKKGVQF